MLKTQPTLLLDSPVCSFETFAISSGVSEETVKGWAKNKHIPTKKIGKRRLINLVKLRQELLKEA